MTDTARKPPATVALALSPGACELLAELTEKATAPGGRAAALAELYAAAQRAATEAKGL